MPPDATVWMNWPICWIQQSSQLPDATTDGGVIRTGFNKELDELRSISHDGQTWLQAYQKQQIERTGIDKLKVGFNQVFGYYIEISRSNADKVPADYVRKQTISNAERYITDELKKYETRALGAEKALALEAKTFRRGANRRAHISPDSRIGGHNRTCDCLCKSRCPYRQSSRLHQAQIDNR